METQSRKSIRKTSLVGNVFEREVLDTLATLGYKVDRNVHIRGCQVDIYCEFYTGAITIRLMVECKNYDGSRMVGIDAVNKFAGILAVARNNGIVDKGLIVTTNGFTAQAKANARVAGIELKTYSELSTQLVNFDTYIDRIISEYESLKVSRYYIELSGTETEDYDDPDTIFFRPIDGFIQQCLFNNDRSKVALLGNFGTGKSTFCQRYAYTLAQQYKRDHSARVPVLINLKDFEAGVDIQTLILNTLMIRYGINLTLVISLALQRIGKFLLIFDGFDEMDIRANPDTVRENLRQLNKVLEIKRNKIIITCRTHFFRNRVQAEVLSNFDIAYIPEWGEIELKEYLQKRFGKKWKSYVRQISGTHNLPDLARTPLFLEMITETLAELGNNVKRIELYRAYTATWNRQQSERKGALLNPGERMGFIKELAMKLYRENRPSCHFRELKDALRHFLVRTQPEEEIRFEIDNAAQLDYLRNDVQTCTFLIRDRQGNYSFRHKSFMEFFVAWTMAEEIRSDSCKYLEKAILPVEIRGFLIDFLSEGTPATQLLRYLEEAKASVLKDNLLSLISRLHIEIPNLQQARSVTDPDIERTFRFMQGDTKAFNEIYLRYYHYLVAYLKRMSPWLDDLAAEDAATDAFLVLWQKRDQLESMAHMRGFLFVTARNRVFDLARTKRIMRKYFESIDLNEIDDAPAIEKEMDYFDLRTTLQQGINQLSPREKEIMEELYINDRSIHEVAIKCKISLSTVHNTRHKAIAKLKVSLLGKR